MGVKTKRSLALFVFVVLAASLGAFSLSLAFADDGFVVDEDDSPGPLDIERFGFFQEETGGRLILDLYEDFDPSFLDESLNWVGFVLEDDIADGEYERAVFVRRTDEGLVARLYRDGRTGSDAGTFVGNVGVQQTDPNTLEVVIPPRQYAPFHHWYAQTAFETIGEDDRGYPECNWPTPPPRPFPPMAKCIDESMQISPTFDESASPTVTPSDPPCAFRQSQCRKHYITIHRGDSGFYGVVRHRNDVCESRRVFLRRARDDEVVGTTVTKTGKWKIKLEKAPASYYAVAKRVEYEGNDGPLSCRRIRSITIEG